MAAAGMDSGTIKGNVLCKALLKCNIALVDQGNGDPLSPKSAANLGRTQYRSMNTDADPLINSSNG